MKLTKDEIMQFEGRALDKAIMVHVVGFKESKIFAPDWDDRPDSENWHYIPSGKPKRTHMIDAVMVPHFHKDLNACAAAETHMGKECLAESYAYILSTQVLDDAGMMDYMKHGIDGTDLFCVATAPPADRCRAMLLALLKD